ncbi:hypothetical protein HK102_010813 [Quaeritorhiza haematococci]|nr:hypothetical protein HK102_010813 [Quaeritorhiza haematococci]
MATETLLLPTETLPLYETSANDAPASPVVVATDLNADPYVLHKLVFLNDTTKLSDVLQPYSQDNPAPHTDRLYRGQTPLTLAITMNRKECVRLLLEAGASTLDRNADGWGPFQEATSIGDREMMEWIYRRRRSEFAAWFNKKGAAVLEQLSKDLKDFSLEMRWQFRSWLPLVSGLCPSDTYKIYKKGTNVRIDTTLVGFERLSWVRGDVSVIFGEDTTDNTKRTFKTTSKPIQIFNSEADKQLHTRKKSGDELEGNSKRPGARLVICDHQRRLVQQVYPQSFALSDEEVEEDISINLNTKIVAVPQPDYSSFTISRSQTGFWPFRSDRNEKVGCWDTAVWQIDRMEFVWKTRTEHLDPSLLGLTNGALPSPSSPPGSPKLGLDRGAEGDGGSSSGGSSGLFGSLFGSGAGTNNNNTTLSAPNTSEHVDLVDDDDKKSHDDLDDDEDTTAADDDEGSKPPPVKRAFEELTRYRPSLEPPPPPTMSFDEFFGDPSKRDDFVHLGRPMQQESASRAVRATLWMYDANRPKGGRFRVMNADGSDTDGGFPAIQSADFPLKVENLLPLLELMGMGTNGHVRALKEFFNIQLPAGFPVQVEIPLGMLPLSAVITFENISTTAEIDDNMFRIPGKKEGYRVGEVIKSAYET